MILVTGAAGKTGRAIVRSLADAGQDVRAFIRREDQREELLALGARQAICGDLSSRADIMRAFVGTEKIYHICPNVDPQEAVYARLMIDVASSARVVHFGYHSVLHPQTESMSHHWQKLRVEEALFESALPFTILQPCAYMQNLLGQRESLLKEGVLRVPYSTEAGFSFVDLEDVAASAATILTEPGHIGAIYELAGPEVLNHEQVAEIIGAEMGRPIRAERMGQREWERNARASGMGDHQVAALLSMFDYYERFGFWGNSNVLTMLLGRQPMSFREFVRREFGALKPV